MSARSSRDAALSLPVIVGGLTVAAFSIPVLLSIGLHGRVLVPPGWTRELRVSVEAGLIAILVNLIFLAILAKAPVWRPRVPTLPALRTARRTVALGYALVSLLSFAVMAWRLEMVPMLLSNPLLGILSFGARLGEEKLLLFFFLGLSIFIGQALLTPADPRWLRWGYRSAVVLSLLFYVLLGRREIVLLSLCLLLLTAGTLDLRSPRTYLYFGLPLLLLIVLGITRLDDASDFGLAAEELSPVALSAYVIEHDVPVSLSQLPGGTFLRFALPGQKGISVTFFMHEVDSGDNPTPVLGLAGIAYQYWFVFHLAFAWLLAVAAKSAWGIYLATNAQVLRVLGVFLSFKVFNFFRNGELPIVFLDIVMFGVLILPALLASPAASAGRSVPAGSAHA